MPAGQLVTCQPPRQAWQEALQVRDDLRLPDGLGLCARLEQVGPADAPR